MLVELGHIAYSTSITLFVTSWHDVVILARASFVILAREHRGKLAWPHAAWRSAYGM